MDEFLEAYRAMTDAELNAEQQRLSEALAGDSPTEEDIQRVSALGTVFGERAERARQANEARNNLMGLPTLVRTTAPAPAIARSHSEPVETRTLAQRLMESPGYQAVRANGFHGSGGMEFSISEFFNQRAVITSGQIPSIEPVRQPGYLRAPELVPSLLDVIPTGTIGSGSIEYVEDTSTFTMGLDAGNPVAEGTAKPEATLTLAPKSLPTQTLAGWVAATRQALEDESQLQTYITNRLTQAVRGVLENEAVNGTGVAPHLQGIMGLAQVVTPSAGGDAFTAIGEALAAVQTNGYNPTVIAVNPADWVKFMTAAAAGGAYVGSANPFNSIPLSVWGVPVLVTRSVNAGTALTGDFPMGSTLFYRNDIRILVADQHADLFIKNTLLILAEARVVHAVFAPKAYAKVALA